ncbi:unnamed protein product [Cercopithifilaria johnstoni]|uniref:G-protein coupled receptors family 1 profile domain-containing protein n=1 Tax=Cercopithifilaria johnstoni TaxID=2874296 RepID=A0A8J2LXE2_9BILA|nr:unnamed protein product [Cercopithifilaria johnstoni]
MGGYIIGVSKCIGGGSYERCFSCDYIIVHTFYFTESNPSNKNNQILKCLRTIILINIGAVLLCIPFFFNSEVRKVSSHRQCSARYPSKNNLSAHELSFTIFANNTALVRINFWLLGTMCKLIPCAVMIVMNVLLVHKLRQIRLLSIRFTSPKREKRCRRVTYIIMIIMINFVAVELPQGIISVLSSVKGENFAESELLGDLFDILSLLNSCVTFGIFCSMSSRIRNAFNRELFSFSHKFFQQIVHRLRHVSVTVENSNSNNVQPKVQLKITSDKINSQCANQ